MPKALSHPIAFHFELLLEIKVHIRFYYTKFCLDSDNHETQGDSAICLLPAHEPARLKNTQSINRLRNKGGYVGTFYGKEKLTTENVPSHQKTQFIIYNPSDVPSVT